jgi:hypothetical protein
LEIEIKKHVLFYSFHFSLYGMKTASQFAALNHLYYTSTVTYDTHKYKLAAAAGES